MDSLRIQDVFEPYYAGRKRFPAPGDGNAEASEARSRKSPFRPAEAERPAEAGGTTEH